MGNELNSVKSQYQGFGEVLLTRITLYFPLYFYILRYIFLLLSEQ